MPDQEKPGAKPNRRTIYLPRANPMFLPEMSVLLRFVHYQRPVKCPNCGRMVAKHWTLLCPFRVASMKECQFTLIWSTRIYQPGETVCDECFLEPAEAVTKLFCFPRKEFWEEIGQAGEEYMVRCRRAQPEKPVKKETNEAKKGQ